MKNLMMLVMLILCGSAMAAVSFTEDFSDNALTSNMEVMTGTDYGTATVSYDTGAAVWGGDAAGRTYLRTVAGDYWRDDFVMEADVTITDTGAWGTMFFGIGTGEPGTNYNEPTTPDARFQIHPPSLGNTVYYVDNAIVTISAAHDISTAGTHHVKLTWTAATQTAQLDADLQNDGVYEWLASVDGSNNGFDDASGHLYFGGGNGLTFDNIVVTTTAIPEPATMSIIGLGMIGLLKRNN